jgi:protein TonB
LTLGLFAFLASMISNPIEYSTARVLPRIDFSPVIRPIPPIDLPLPPDKPMREVLPADVIGPPIDESPMTTTIERGEIFRGEPLTIGNRDGIIGPGTLTSGTDSDTMPVVRIEPVYPTRAEIRGIEGFVRVQFTVTATGQVRDAVVVASEPPGEFDEAALQAVERWRYRPRVVEGVPVERVGVQTLFEFTFAE